ncbi:hypothetical protein L4D76_25115 [Photobacterium sagamiensis]|uniref:hypothetical protein n=1 Tax=Photobacterium sagamiensis TaxID=2910241 RepID=UPI003D0FE5E0
MALPSLSTTQIRKIETLIMSWQTKLTWDLLVDRIKSDLDITTTRQTLPTYSSIKAAYQAKKQELRGKPTTEFVKFVKSDLDKFEQIESLKAENEVLTQKLDKQLAFIKKLGVLAESNPPLVALLNKAKKSAVQGG